MTNEKPEIGRVRDVPKPVTIEIDNARVNIDIDAPLSLEELGALKSVIGDIITRVKYSEREKRRKNTNFVCTECGWEGTDTDTKTIGDPEKDQEIMNDPDIPHGAKPHLMSTHFVRACPECGNTTDQTVRDKH